MEKLQLALVNGKLFAKTKIRLVEGLQDALESITPDIIWANVVGDGVTDDWQAIQNILDTSVGAVTFPAKNFYVSKSLTIDPARIKRINGNNATLIISGDYTALNIVGSMVSGMSADPNTLNETIINEQGGFNVNGLRIYSINPSLGVGIGVRGVFKPIIENNYLINLSDGVVFSGVNRDVVIVSNNIWRVYNSGIKFDSTTNIHQMNICNNHISYCRYCINYDNPIQIANAQIVGNDIETATYPTNNVSSNRCLRIVGSNAGSRFFSELEICGNTIQSHDNTPNIIYIEGAINLSISGNHISNCTSSAIKVQNVKNVCFCGNNYRFVRGSVVSLGGTCQGIAFVGSTTHNSTAFLSSESGSIISDVVVSSNEGYDCSGIVLINSSKAENIRVGSNVISGSGGVTISATTLDYISVTGNMVRGTASYDISSCTHRIVEHNI